MDAEQMSDFITEVQNKPVRDEANLHDAVEDLMVIGGVVGVFRTMINICHEKAEYVQTNWQNDELARQWEKKASWIEQKMLQFERKFR